MLCDDAWTAEDQNYLNPPTPKRKSVHTPFRDDEPVFKIPMAPSPKSSPNPKPSIFTKLSPKIEPKTQRENHTFQMPLLNNNIFGKSLFSDVVPLNNIFQSSSNKQTSQPSTNIFGTSSVSSVPNSQSLFGTQLPSANLFKATSSTNRLFGDSSSSSSSAIFSNFGHASTNQPLSNNFDKPSAKYETKNINEENELKQLELEKQNIEMEIRKEEEAERLRKQERERLQREEERKRKEMEEKLAQERKEKERMEKDKAEALKRLQHIALISEQSVAELINEFVQQELEVIANKSLACYHQIESATEDIYYELLAEIIFEESADWERMNQEKIDKIENTPIWIPDKPLMELVPDLMHPQQDETLNMSKRYRHGMPSNLSFPTKHDNQIDVFEIVPPQLVRNRSTIERIQKKPTFWKCGISIPSSIEDKSYQRIEKWLDKIFLRREPVNSKLFFCEQRYAQSIQQDVAICLRKFRGSGMSNEDGITDDADKIGLDAIIFLMSASNPKETKKRFLKVLQYQSVDCAIGIVMLNVDNIHEPILRSELELDELIDSEYPIKYFYSKASDVVPSPLTRNKLLAKSFKFVASNFNFKSTLEMQTTTSFFDQCLGNQFWHRISTSSTLNPGLFKAATNIRFIIETYNTALKHLDKLVTEDLTNHPLFPQEFRRFVKVMSSDITVEYQHFPCDWKNSNRPKQLHNFLMSLKMQPATLKTSSLEEIQEQLLVYAHNHIEEKARSDRAAYRMIKVLLEYCETNSDIPFEQQISTFNWINAMRLLTLEILLYRYEQRAQSIPKEVIYNREKFKRYLNDPWWLQDTGPMNKVRLSFDHFDENNGTEPKKPRLDPIDKEDLEQLIARGAACLQEADRKIDKFKTTVNIGREITQDLDSLLYEHERNLRVQKRWSQLQ